MEKGRRISIHALREEGDPLRTSIPWVPVHFYPRPPRGGDRPASITTAGANNFIHALREEGDKVLVATDAIESISIHALRRATPNTKEQVDMVISISIHALREEATLCCPRCPLWLRISIHALREGDRMPDHCERYAEFLSTPSARRRIPAAGINSVDMEFLSALREGAT